MKKILVCFCIIGLAIGLSGPVGAALFEDFIDYWSCTGTDWGEFSTPAHPNDSVVITEWGEPLNYFHDINDDVNLATEKVISAGLQLDFTGLLDIDPVFWFFVWVDVREYARYALEGGSFVELGEIDTSNDIYDAIVDVALLNDNGILGVTVDVWNPHGQGTIQLDHSKLTGETAPVPEPATMLLLGSGLVGLAGFGRKKFRKS